MSAPRRGVLRWRAATVAAVGTAVLASAPAHAQGLDTTCVLPLTKFDPVTINVAYPDQSAVYWVGAYVGIPGTRLRIQGEFPHARYMSFNVYDPALRPLDAIADAELVPADGHVNPFLAGAARDGARRSYTAFIEFGPRPQRHEDRAPNTIYTGTGQDGSPNVAGTFLYRVYIPDRGRNETGGAGLPTVTLQAKNGGPAPRSICSNLSKPPLLTELHELIENSDAEIPLIGNRPQPTPVWRKFTNFLYSIAPNELTRVLGGSGGFFSNLHNEYVSASVSREFGKVVTTRMRAPNFADTRGGTLTMPSGAQLRYFSLCQNHSLTQRYIACRADDQTVVDRDGFMTYVMSTPAQRPATATSSCGVTWIPWGPFREGGLIYRHMLPAADFREAIQLARHDHEAETMGDFFPVSRYLADKAAYDREIGCRTAESRASRRARQRRAAAGARGRR